jgi:branched-chain amino acid transport system ATP-binding protein
MRFGGLVAINDLSFRRADGATITALIGPNGAGKTTVFNCVTGFYRPTMGMLTMTQRDGAALHLESGMNDFPHQPQAKVARTFQNIRLFTGHDRAGKPAGRAAQHADARVGLYRAGPSGLSGLPQGFGRGDPSKARYWLDRWPG